MGIESTLQSYVNRSKTPGLQYVAVRADGRVDAFAVGLADIQRQRVMTSATSLMAYSMSKTVTAIATLQAVQDGRLTLDTPVASVLPESPYGDAVTIRHLITHTGGIPNPIPLRWVHAAAEHDAFDEQQALAGIMRAHPRLARAPGVRYQYSNIGYWMLGAIIERVTGESFVSRVTTRVLRPLGLTDVDAGYRIVDPESHAAGYLERWSAANLLGRWLIDRRLLGSYEGAWRRIGDHYPNGPAFGGLVGTASAFARLLLDQLQPHSVLLDDEGRALLYAPQTTRTGHSVPMTLGWHVVERDGAPMFFKEGGGGGFHCEMRLYPSRGFGSVVMTNATGFPVKACLDRVDFA